MVESSPGNITVRPWFDSTRYPPLASANSIPDPIITPRSRVAACSVPEIGMSGWKNRPS